jgi:hypothetical protein
MKRLLLLFASVTLSLTLSAQTTSMGGAATAQPPAAGSGDQIQTTGGYIGTTSAAPLVTTPSVDLGGPLTPPVLRTAPTVIVVTPGPISTPTVVTVPAAPSGEQASAVASTRQGLPIDLGAARMVAFGSSDTRSLGDIAAQYRRKDGTQHASSRVYTNADIARLNREQARDLDLPMSDRDDTEKDNPDTTNKTTPAPPQPPR